jgi:hypothetical protein
MASMAQLSNEDVQQFMENHRKDMASHNGKSYYDREPCLRHLAHSIINIEFPERKKHLSFNFIFTVCTLFLQRNWKKQKINNVNN